MVPDRQTTLPQRFPDFVGRIKKFNEWGSIQVAGVFRIIDYRNPINFNISTTPGWGVALSGNVKLTKKEYQAAVKEFNSLKTLMKKVPPAQVRSDRETLEKLQEEEVAKMERDARTLAFLLGSEAKRSARAKISTT